jgi:hypothetical protein
MRPKVHEHQKNKFQSVGKKIIMLFCLAPLLMANTCDDEDHDHHHPCTAEARAALNITVTISGEAITSDAGITVTARDGSYIEALETHGQPVLFSGAYERVGQYTITVTKQGYQDYESAPIVVLRDECHVIPQQLTVDLIPNP